MEIALFVPEATPLLSSLTEFMTVVVRGATKAASPSPTSATRHLTSFFPKRGSAILAWVATLAEVAFAILLLLGLRVRAISLLSGLLLLR